MASGTKSRERVDFTYCRGLRQHQPTWALPSAPLGSASCFPPHWLPSWAASSSAVVRQLSVAPLTPGSQGDPSRKVLPLFSASLSSDVRLLQLCPTLARKMRGSGWPSLRSGPCCGGLRMMSVPNGLRMEERWYLKESWGALTARN